MNLKAIQSALQRSSHDQGYAPCISTEVLAYHFGIEHDKFLLEMQALRDEISFDNIGANGGAEGSPHNWFSEVIDSNSEPPKTYMTVTRLGFQLFIKRRKKIEKMRGHAQRLLQQFLRPLNTIS